MSDLPSPSKELGQHFLTDDNIVRVIGRLADVREADVVLEIGPGQGVLTAYLAEHAGVVHAVELDHRLEPHQGVGRRRLLRAMLHEREGPRAGRHDRPA